MWYRKLIESSKLIEKWNASKWAQKLDSQAKRAKLNDFERFQVMVLKRQVLPHYSSIRKPIWLIKK
jgi:hypothetical protein